MKAALALLCVLASSPAFASMNLMTSQYDGTMLTYSYQTGGGCDDHSGKASVSKIEVTQGNGYKTVDLKVSIDDITKSGKEDLCRAIVFVTGRVNITELAKKTLKAEGIDTEAEPLSVNVQLPQISVQVY